MAMSTLRLSVEEKNYWKFCMLNVRVVPVALRNYFDGLIPPTSLATTINQHSTTISNLVKRKVINAVQLNILKKIPGTIWPPRVIPVHYGPTATSSADFDVSLLVCLLRNIPLPGMSPPSTGWNNLPMPNNSTPGAYLARIKYYRNELAHATKNHLNTIDFQDRWKTIKEAIQFCNGGHIPNAIKEILHCDLDGSQNGSIVAALSTEIKAIKQGLTVIECEKNAMKNELKKTAFQLENVRSDFHFYKDGHLPKNISDNVHDLIKKWKKEDKHFFITRAVQCLYDSLESKNIVMIIGHSGSGKSAAARNVALTWQSYGYHVVPVESVENILEFRCKDTKQIFVIDDVVGKYSVNRSFLNQWEKLDSKLKTLFIDNHAKLICTLRKVLAVDSQFRAATTVLSETAFVIDLDHENNCLRPEEKLSILKNHLISSSRQNDISDEECKDCCQGNFAFPLLCHVFATSDGLFKSKSDFFRKPFNYLNDEITKLHQQNKEVYCSLVICMIFSGRLRANMFSVSDETNEEQKKSGRIFSMISETCGLHRNISRQTLLDRLLSVEGVYIKNCFGAITFVHDSFLEAFSFHFSKVNICVFLKCCDSEFLKERVRVISPLVNDDQNVIVLQEESFYHLAYRFITELKKGEFLEILCSQPIKEEKFINVLSKVIDHGHMISKKKLMNMAVSQVPVWILYDRKDKQKRNSEAVAAIVKVFPTNKTLFHWVIAAGLHNFFDYFWKSMSHKEQRKYLRADMSIFTLALLSGSKEIIKPMLERGADVNCPESRYALQRLVVSGRNNKLLEFLVNNDISMNFIDGNRKSPLFYAITSGNLKFHAFLVERESRQNALHEAVYSSNMEKAKYFIRSVNIDSVSNCGWNVFHFAAYNNDIAMMKLLFDTSMKKSNKMYEKCTKAQKCKAISFVIDKRDKVDWSPLHIASILASHDAIEFLIGKGANVHLVDIDGKTPLHFSSNEHITKCLLKQYQCSKEPHTSEQCVKTPRNIKHSSVKRNQRSKTKDQITNVMENPCIYINEVVLANNIHFEKDKNKNWVPYMNDSPIYEDFMKTIPENFKKWHPSLFSLIYVTCMNILFLCFNIVKFRKKIDIPDDDGNTYLHAAATMESHDDSIASVKLLLERGANPLFYNINGCMSSDAAFYRRSYKVKLFLDIYSLHTLRKNFGILILVSIIAFLLVISLCTVSYYVCPDFEKGDKHNNLYNGSIRNFHNYLNTTLNSDTTFILHKHNTPALLREQTEEIQDMYIHPFGFIQPLAICFVLVLNLACSIRKQIRWRQKYFAFECISHDYVHSTTLLISTSMCFSNQPTDILQSLIIFSIVTNLFVLIVDVFISFNQKYYPDWLIFIPAYIQLIFYCIVIFISLLFYNPFTELSYSISLIIDMMEALSIMSLLFSFSFTFIGIYIYINVFSCCVFLILLKIWEISNGIRQSAYCMHLNIFYLCLRSPLSTFPRLSNPSFKWHIIVQSAFIFVLLIFETIVVYQFIPTKS